MNFNAQILQAFLYLFIPLVIFIGFLSTTNQFQKIANLNFFLILILLCMLMLLRKADSGTDSPQYTYMYSKINAFGDIFTQYHGNFFFSFVMYLGKMMSLDTNSYFIFHSLIVVVLYAWSSRLFLPKPFAALSLALFGTTSSFIFYSSNIIRQGLGCSLFILAFGFWVHKRKKWSALLQLFSLFSHTSAVFLILTNLLKRFFQNKIKIILALMPIMPLPGFFLLRIFSVIGGIFKKIDGFSAKDYNNTLVYIKIVMLYVCAIGFYNFFKNLKATSLSPRIYDLFLLYTLMLCICFLTLPVLLLSSRLIYYPSAFLPILFSYAIMHLCKGRNKLVYTFIWGWLSLFYAIFVFSFKSTVMQLGL